MTSCATLVYQTADVSLMDGNGDIIRFWDNAVIATQMGDMQTSPIKEGGGFAFTTKQGESVYTSGGILLVENIGKKAAPRANNQPTSTGGKQYAILQDIDKVNKELKDVKTKIKETTNPDELRKLQQREAELSAELKELKVEYSKTRR